MSPLPWLSDTVMEVQASQRDKDPEVRSPVRESAREMQKTGGRATHRRRRTRERIRERDRDRDERGDQRDRYDRSYSEKWAGRSPDDTRASSHWEHGAEEPRRRRRPQAGGGAGHQQVDEVLLPGNGFDGRAPPKMSEEDLRQQLGSLVTLCEQLLHERAERERAERESLERESGIPRAGGRRPERSERSSAAAGGASPSGGGRHSGRGHHADIANLPIGYGGNHGHVYDDPSGRVAQSSHAMHSGRDHSIHSGRDYSGRDRSGRRSGREHRSDHSGPHHSGREHGGRQHVAQDQSMHTGLSPGHGGQDESMGGQDNSMMSGLSPGYANRAASGHASPSPAPRNTGRAVPSALPSVGLSGDEGPLDSLASLVAQSAIMPAAAAAAASRAPRGAYRLNDIEEQPDPFAAPKAGQARGMSVRRPSGNVGYGSHLMMSPPPVGCGLNLQANWPAFGRSGLTDDDSGVFSPPSAGLAGGFPGERYSSPPGQSSGPGHIPIGIRPSIQAQSAMLRELYPHGPLAAGPAGPLPAP